MIRHIVLFKLKDNTPEKVAEAAQVLKDMKGRIDELLSIEVGTNVVESPRAYDIALITCFQSKKELDIYQDHEVHLPVKKYMGEVCESIVAVDYEV